MFAFITVFLLSFAGYAQVEILNAELYQLSPEKGDSPETILNKYGALEEMHFQFLKDYSQYKELDADLECKIALHFQENLKSCKSQILNLSTLQKNWPQGTEIFVETDKVQEGQILAANSDYSWTAFPPANEPVKFYGKYDDFLNYKKTLQPQAAFETTDRSRYWKWALGVVALGFAANYISQKKLVIDKTW